MSNHQSEKLTPEQLEKIMNISNQIHTLNYGELMSLTKKITEQYGIPLESVISMITSGGGTQNNTVIEKEPQEQKVEQFFTVKIDEITGSKVAASKKVQEIYQLTHNTEIGLMQIKLLLDKLPYVLIAKTDQEKANNVKTELESSGLAIVSLHPTD